jgi:hypothetical protein
VATPAAKPSCVRCWWLLGRAERAQSWRLAVTAGSWRGPDQVVVVVGRGRRPWVTVLVLRTGVYLAGERGHGLVWGGVGRGGPACARGHGEGERADEISLTACPLAAKAWCSTGRCRSCFAAARGCQQVGSLFCPCSGFACIGDGRGRVAWSRAFGCHASPASLCLLFACR